MSTAAASAERVLEEAMLERLSAEGPLPDASIFDGAERLGEGVEQSRHRSEGNVGRQSRFATRRMTRNASLDGLYGRQDRFVVAEMDDAQRDGLIDAIGAAHTSRADDRALELFVVTHYARLIGLAGLVCGDASAAEDIVQTALERAWRARASLGADGRLRPWLDRIVVREAARERRARLTWLARLVRRPAVTEIGVAVTDRELVDRAAGRYPADAEVRMVLAALTPPHRAAIVLHLHAGYSVDETAEILGVPRETVRSRLRVAREQLRRALGEGQA